MITLFVKCWDFSETLSVFPTYHFCLLSRLSDIPLCNFIFQLKKRKKLIVQHIIVFFGIHEHPCSLTRFYTVCWSTLCSHLISLNGIMGSSKNGRWIIRFKKIKQVKGHSDDQEMVDQFVCRGMRYCYLFVRIVNISHIDR